MKFKLIHIICVIGSAGIGYLVLSALYDILIPSGESLVNEYIILTITTIVLLIVLLKAIFTR